MWIILIILEMIFQFFLNLTVSLKLIEKNIEINWKNIALDAMRYYIMYHMVFSHCIMYHMILFHICTYASYISWPSFI